MLNQTIATIVILIAAYILSHLFRLITKKTFCAKCSALIISIILLFLFRFKIEIIALLLGALLTILTYYIDDWLRRKSINKIAQDFFILLGLMAIGMVILWIF